MRRSALVLVLALATPFAARAWKAPEPHPDNDLGFPLGVFCAPYFETVDSDPVFDNQQGNPRAANLSAIFDPSRRDDDYYQGLCDTDGSGTLTTNDAIFCCKRMNGREVGHGSSVSCRSFQLSTVQPVDQDGDGTLDYYLVLINPNGPPDACGVNQSALTRGFGNVVD